MQVPTTNTQTPRMKRFLRENWIYIVAPIVIVIVLLGALYFIGGGNEASA